MEGLPRPRVLYIAYWGATEPLGQSLIVPAVAKMAERGADISLITFEKLSDWRRETLVAETAARLHSSGVDWSPSRYHKTPRIPATSFDVLRGWWKGVRIGLRSRVQLVHGRTFVGGLIGRAVASTLRVPFLYHNEGFYPDEMVDGGFWREGSAIHRFARALERRQYASADGLIVLSHRAADRLRATPELVRNPRPIVVVPSCVDLARFQPPPARRPGGGPLRIVYTGAVGGRYELDRAGAFVARLSRYRDVQLTVLTRESRETVVGLLGAGGLPASVWDLDTVAHRDMPMRLGTHDAGLFFLKAGSSALGCSPTKIGEYWACGLPVVTSPGVSDTDALIDRFRCGVVVADQTLEALDAASQALLGLLDDPETPTRCRAAAESHYSLDLACDRQLDLYRQTARRGG
jgi:glycosyltransferase involved in cell wall biosynthesis